MTTETYPVGNRSRGTADSAVVLGRGELWNGLELDAELTCAGWMKDHALPGWLRAATILSINLLYLMVWGFASVSKLREGMPSWFGEKFGATFLGWFPGLTATFWILALSELVVFGLALVALVRVEFLGRREPRWLGMVLVGSLFVFLQLGFGQWLTREFNGAYMQFCYFVLTLICLQMVVWHGGAARPRV